MQCRRVSRHGMSSQPMGRRGVDAESTRFYIDAESKDCGRTLEGGLLALPAGFPTSRFALPYALCRHIVLQLANQSSALLQGKVPFPSFGLFATKAKAHLRVWAEDLENRAGLAFRGARRKQGDRLGSQYCNSAVSVGSTTGSGLSGTQQLPWHLAHPAARARHCTSLLGPTFLSHAFVFIKKAHQRLSNTLPTIPYNIDTLIAKFQFLFQTSWFSSFQISS